MNFKKLTEQLRKYIDEQLIEENCLGQKINNPQAFWKWFGDSITVDEQGRPLIFYHGTRKSFNQFKSTYDDKLIFFSFEKKFADDWGRTTKRFSRELEDELEDLLSEFRRKLYKEYVEKYGENFYLENGEPYKQFRTQVNNYEIKLETERDVHARTLPCYLKVHKIFVPERDYELVLNEIFEYYKWDKIFTKEYKQKANELYNKWKQLNDEVIEWIENNPDADENIIKEKRQQVKQAGLDWRALQNPIEERQNDLDRIKKGAWIYFEHGIVIDTIWELGYDAIQLSEAAGMQTTLAVRQDNNQIKCVHNKGTYNSSENIYEQINEESAMQPAVGWTFNQFYNWSIKNKNPKQKLYFEIKNTRIRIPSDTILHDFNRHKINIPQWDDCISNLHNIQNYCESKKSVNGNTTYLCRILGYKDFGVTLSAGKAGYLYINTIYIDHPNSIDNWISMYNKNQHTAIKEFLINKIKGLS